MIWLSQLGDKGFQGYNKANKPLNYIEDVMALGLDAIVKSVFDGGLTINRGNNDLLGTKMAKKAKKVAAKKSKVKKPTKKPSKKKAVAKKSAKKSYSVKAVKKTARSLVKAAGKRTTAAKKTGKKFVDRAIKAIVDVSSPLIPGGETKS